MRRALISLGLLTVLASCGGALKDYKDKDIPDKPDTPDTPDTGRTDHVDANACGNYASTNIGKQIKAFLKATNALDKAVHDAENHVKLACIDMGKELEMSDGDLKGDTKKVCNAVATKLDATLKASVKAEAKLEIEYKPAVCTIDASVQARAQAACGGSASTGTGGSSGDGACASSAEVEASLVAKCTPAELKVSGAAGIAVDEAKLAMAVKAIEVGLPKILDVYGRMVVIKKAAVAWVAAAKALAGAGRTILSDIDDQLLCVSGQIAAALDMVGSVMGSIEITVTVSVEVSGSAGAAI